MGALLQDLRYGLRMLANNPGVTAVAVPALATGIAVNTAIFSVCNAAMLRPDLCERGCNSYPNRPANMLELSGKPVTVAGITPAYFRGTYASVPSGWPALGTFPVLEPKRDPLHDRDDHAYRVFGRLTPG